VWKTRFVFENIEITSPQTLPAFSVGGEILKYKIDTFDGSKVPCVYKVTKIIFDVDNVIQYVHGERIL
jgi:hypothetical protein